MTYKVMELIKDLPGTNCGYCGKPGCMAFAVAVYFEGFPLSACAVLEPEKHAEMESKLARDKAPENETTGQALAALMEQLRGMELAEVALRAGARFDPGPVPALRLPFLGDEVVVSGQGVENQDRFSNHVAILILIYLTRTNGRPPRKNWAAFRELPNAMGKARSFEEAQERLARETPADILRREAVRMGGRAVASDSADLALEIDVLPRVPVLILYWGEDEDFPPRASILLDCYVLDHLDLEAITFMAEILAQALTGGSLKNLVA